MRVNLCTCMLICGTQATLSPETILRRSKGRLGLHLVQVKFAKHNCRRIHEPSREVRAWFDEVEPNLLVYELNLRVRLRKKWSPRGAKVVRCVRRRLPRWSCFFCVRRLPRDGTSGPYVAGCAVCSVRTLHRSRLELVGRELQHDYC